MSASPSIALRLTAAFTAEPLADALQFWLKRLAAPWSVEFAGYNQVFQELLDPASASSTNARGVNILLVRGCDSPSPQARAELERAAAAALGRGARWIAVVTPSEAEADAALLSSLRALPALEVLDGAELVAAYDVGTTLDPEAERLGRIPYTAEYFAALGTALARRVHARTRKPFKVVAVDADHTLWHGVVGEVGVSGLVVGENHRLLQERLVSLKNAGLLLALVSKNERADAEAALAQHPDMLVRPADFVALKANWQPKSENLAALASELELGLDSFLFLDDNPVEAAEVAAHLPAVTALTVPTDAAGFRSFLAHTWTLDVPASTTAIDAARTELYRAQAQRADFRTAAADFQAFLDGLQLEATFAEPTADDVPRLAQLTQRTNQFNATGKRRTDAELASDLANGLRGLHLSARDRFGDYGLVGFAAGTPQGSTFELDTFLLSCRALGKGLEHRLVQALAGLAERCGCAELAIPFTETERNAPAAAFLRKNFPSADSVHRIPLEAAKTCRLTVDATVAPAEAGTSVAGTAPAAAIPFLPTAHAILTAVREAARRPRPADLTFREPAPGLESSIAAHFAEALAVEPIGADDDFFQLGGQSVLATRVLARLSREFGHRLPLRTLFDHRTPAGLASHVSSLQPTEHRAVARVPRDAAAFPLSHAQRRMWFLDSYAPGNAAYHIVAARRLTGPLDPDRLRAALLQLVRHHEALRATFPSLDGQPVQKFVAAEQAFTFQVVDSDVPDPQAAIRLDGPLVHARLHRVSPTEHVLVVIVHHIVADGWSMGVFFRDLSRFYAGQTPAPLALQTLDLAAHQDALFTSGAFESDLAHWREALKHAPEALNLPTDFPRPADRTFDGALVTVSLPADLISRLETLARGRDATLFMAMMAAWHVLLHRWSGQDDVLVGTPVSGRSDAAAESQIGCFINTLVVRSQPSPELPFSDFLGGIRETTLSAFAHQDLPFERLVEALEVRRSLAHSPFFQVMFVLQNTPSGDLALPHITTEPLPLHNGTAKFDLVLESTPRADGSHQLALEYNTALFRADTAERLLRAFATLLASIVEKPATPLSQLDLLTPAESHELVHGFNDHRDFPTPAPTIHEWFEQAVARFPQRTAVTCEGTALTYAELNERANRVAHFLQSHGVRPGTPVGICMERTAHLVAGLLGILKAGGAYVPIDLSYPADRLAFMLEDTQAPVLITQTHLAEKLPPHQARVLCLDDASDPLATQPVHNPTSGATAADTIYIIYTSGSTGRPKGCCLTHVNVTRLISATRPWFAFDEHDVWTLFHSYAFDFSVWELWGALLFGGRLVVVPYLVSRSPEDFHALLSEEKVTVLNQTPSAFRQLIAADQATARPLALRYVVFGGEALEMQSLQPWFDRHGDRQPQLVNMYGITETTVHVTYRPLSRDDLQRGSVIGVPIPDLRVYILDANLRPCPIGVPGEMFVGGAGVARGYLNRAELTAQRFIPSPFVEGDRLYRTGDLARFLPERDIEYLGRIDRQVKIRGFRIELGEIESTLLTHPQVREAAVIPREGLSGKQLVAYLVAPDAPAVEALRTHLRQTLPDYMVPAAWVFLEKFPLTANGKLDTNALPAPEADRPAATDYAAPETPIQQALADIWQSVLRLDRVGLHDNFFSLGGDSILTIQVVSRVRQAGWPISPKHLFEHQTIAELAACAEKLAPAKPASSLVATTGAVRLTPIQSWFQSHGFTDAHWWNQAFLFDLQRPASRDALVSALEKVIAHHSIFRLQLGAAQRYTEAPAPLRLADTPEAAHRAVRSENGPLLAAVIAPQSLFLAAHHNVVDGITWRILLEDLEAALDGRPLPAPTDPFSAWADALHAQAPKFRAELLFWQSLTTQIAPALPPDVENGAPNLESTAVTHESALSAEETETLLRALPEATRARIDEILLTALTLAFRRVTGRDTLSLHTEGHGREEVIDGVDVSRSPGWFTSLYPVTLQAAGDAARSLAAVKTQLRAIPHRGIGYGLLRWIDGSMPAHAEPTLVFNYLGQFDGLTAGSKAFRFATTQPAVPWHAPENERTHHIEVDAMIRDGRFQATFRFSREVHTAATQAAVVGAFTSALRELLALTDAPATASPADFPLVTLTQPQLDSLLARHPALETLWPLSPMQALFHSHAASRGGAVLDQWHGRLRGPLDVARFQAAWAEIIARHPLLRASVDSSTGEPLLAIHRSVAPMWQIDDWSGQDAATRESGITSLLVRGAQARASLAAAPVHHFTLVKLADDEHFFLWSVPDLLLDGWSWPVVFREVSLAYQNHRLPAAPSFGAYLGWLATRDAAADEAFWRAELAGLTAPTPLPLDRSGTSPRTREHSSRVEAATWQKLTAAAKSRGTTPGACVLAAWAHVLAGASGQSDVVFGTAFSGRPADLPQVDRMVGPMTTNLPVRVDPAAATGGLALATALRDQLFRLSGHQFTSPLQLERWSPLPWRHRLFESLVVFQNYEVSADARRLGPDVAIADFTGPIHTNFALTLMATPDATGLHLALVVREALCSEDRASAILATVRETLSAMADDAPLPAVPFSAQPPAAPTRTSPAVAPRSDMERRIHAVWVQAFGPHVGVEDNFFDAGGHSLLAMRVLARLRTELGRPLGAADLFQHPTIAALARHLGGGPSAPSAARAPSALDAAKARAAKARAVLTRT